MMEQQKYKIGDMVRCELPYRPYNKQKMIVQICNISILGSECTWTRASYIKCYHIKVIAGPKQTIDRLLYATESDLHKLSDEELTLILLEK